MKKRLFSAVLTAALTLSALTAVPTYVTADEAVPDSSVSAESEQTKNYWIFYKNIDTTEIDNVASQKAHDYEYSLYDTEKDARTIERLVTDYYQSMRLEMLKDAFAEKSAEILSELGVEPSAAWCSRFTPSIVCSLTEEQYQKALNSDIITEINLYTPPDLQPATDIADALEKKEEILNAYTRSTDGKSLCDDYVKFDVVLNAGKDNRTDYLVVYGLKSKDDISKVKSQLDRKHFWENPTMELYSGVSLYDIAKSQGNRITPVIFVEDEALGWAFPVSIKEYSEQVGFDVSPYIISLGDGNGDYKIDALDASEALSLYSAIQTNKNNNYSAEQLRHLDVDNDGAVNALDASNLLSYYSFIATGGTASLKDYLK
ncbi:dockerin type I domain-containing protein [Ruminococcus flavefaciens]|uniref:dockerin type I domain-containing protein n=1 Tax=Ruminococcus flavefaciens TaxID=1265 RepID=UPI0026F0FDBB|nr:dockerin type I domain-containing protein [Ruminococcus flavefaciens]